MLKIEMQHQSQNPLIFLWYALAIPMLSVSRLTKNQHIPIEMMACTLFMFGLCRVWPQQFHRVDFLDLFRQSSTTCNWYDIVISLSYSIHILLRQTSKYTVKCEEKVDIQQIKYLIEAETWKTVYYCQQKIPSIRQVISSLLLPLILQYIKDRIILQSPSQPLLRSGFNKYS